MKPTLNTAASPRPRTGKRRAMVIVVVLVVIAALSLSAYRYSDTMLTEYKASESMHRSVQTKLLADSGIHYAAAVLRDPANLQGGSLGNNPEIFRGITVKTERGEGKFSLICPGDPDDATGGFAFGVIDEGGKINLNALMKRDPTGDMAYKMLLKLPNMTDEIANAIIDWMDPDTEMRPGGAENDFYSALTPSYRCKNGPIDSIDELLLVKGVSRDLLYGTDANRNNFQDKADPAGEGFVRGWAAYLTVHSREPNRDAFGEAPVFLNNADIENKVFAVLGPELEGTTGGADLAKFLVMYRQYPPPSSTGGTQSLGSTLAALFGAKANTTSTKTVEGKLANYTPKFTRSLKYEIKSIFALVEAQAVIESVNGKTRTRTIYTSPLKDPEVQRELLPRLFERATLEDDTQPEMPARINVNTAPREVLMSLIGASGDALTEADVDKIIATRPKVSDADGMSAAFQTPAWLVTEAQLKPAALAAVEKFITTRSQVYRVQSVGYFDGKGPAIRVEAVIDANAGRPRIVAWRDLSELGKGFDDSMP